MRKRALIAAFVLFGATLPALACNDPVGTRMPDEQDKDQDDEKRPDGEDGTAMILDFSEHPIVV